VRGQLNHKKLWCQENFIGENADSIFGPVEKTAEGRMKAPAKWFIKRTVQ
jgi:hypothetical protein